MHRLTIAVASSSLIFKGNSHIFPLHGYTVSVLAISFMLILNHYIIIIVPMYIQHVKRILD